MSQNLKRYDRFGWDYEHFNPLSEEEVSWYVRFARKTGGPVLGLACGTARLLMEIARDGFTVDGIDLSEGMLELAARKIEKLPTGIDALIQLHCMDMADFQLPRAYGLILIADNSLRELRTERERRSCLGCVERHLRSDGILLVTERRFDPDRFGVESTDGSWSDSIPHPLMDARVQRKVKAELSEDGAWIRGSMIYRIISADGTETIEDCFFKAPVMHYNEYFSLFAEAGFSVKSYVDYQEREEDGRSPILCFVCEKAG